MEPLEHGQLVKVSTGGPAFDGIVFDIPSHNKVVVAVVDPKRGPAMRTYSPAEVSEREESGPQDAALHSLIRRTPATGRGGAKGAGGPVQGRAGHARSTMHRTTGK